MERSNEAVVAAEVVAEVEDKHQPTNKPTSQQRLSRRKLVCRYEDPGRAAVPVAAHARAGSANMETMTGMIGMVQLRRRRTRVEGEAESVAVEDLLVVEPKHHRWPN